MPPHIQGREPLGLGELALRSPDAVALAAPHCRSLTFRGLVDQIESAGEALRNATPTSLNPYIGTTVTKLNPGQTYEADKQSVQTLDQIWQP